MSHHHHRYHFRILTIRKPLQMRIPSWLLSPHGCLGRGARRAPGTPAPQLTLPSLPGLSSPVTWPSMDPRTDREKTGHHALRFPKVSDSQPNRNLELGLASDEICRGSLQSCSPEKMEPCALEESGEGVNSEQAIPAWLLMTSWVAANPEQRQTRGRRRYPTLPTGNLTTVTRKKIGYVPKVLRQTPAKQVSYLQHTTAMKSLSCAHLHGKQSGVPRSDSTLPAPAPAGRLPAASPGRPRFQPISGAGDWRDDDSIVDR